MTTTETERTLLDEEHAAAVRRAGPRYDRDNAFFTEDFEELRGSGYFLASVPQGARRRRVEPGRDQPRCSGASPTSRRRPRSPSTCTTTSSGCAPTSTGPAIRPATGCCEKAAEGHVFAAGHGEAGNDIPVLLSSSKAERVDGGWEFTGHKIFGSLSPVWTYLGIHAHGHQRSGQPAGRPRVPPPRRAELPHRGDVGHARACGRRRRTTRSSTGPFVPDEAIDHGLPGRVRRCRDVPRRPVRLGAARLRRRVLVDRPPGVRRDRRQDAPAHVDGADPLDGLPPRACSTRSPRCASTSRRSTAHLDRVSATTGPTASTTAWTGRRRSSPASTTSSTGRGPSSTPPSTSPAAPASSGAAGFEQLFRDARLGRIHPGNIAADPRARRQAEPRHQPRRTAPLGLTPHLAPPAADSTMTERNQER